MTEKEERPLGPKDWDPRTDRCLCPKNNLPLLTKEEKADLKAVERMIGVSVDVDSSVGRVCAAVRRLARITPLDFVFPKHIGFVNPVAESVVSMKLAGSLLIESGATVDRTERVTIMDRMLYCKPPEGIVFVRPYVRIAGIPAEDAVEALRSARMNMEVDGERVIHEGPLEEHLVCPDGHSFRRHPFMLPPRRSSSCLFRAAYVCENPPVGFLDPKTQSFAEFGLLLPHGTKIQMDIIGAGPIPAVTLKTGLVAALYTT